MSKVKLDELELAVVFVDSSRTGNEVFLSRETGKLYYIDDFDKSMSDELPDDFADGDYLSVPDKKELDLGRNLVNNFARGCSPEIQRKIDECFRGRGAYRRFKDLLSHNDLLEEWHTFENQAERDAIIAWCAANKIELDFEIE